MKKILEKHKKDFKKEILTHKFIYTLLFLILSLSFFVRIYRVGTILGFYFDQGRDALVIWDLWHKGKLFLVGPTTGIAGIFRGPFYYYLIAPFYLLGGGNPIYPSIFLAFTSVMAIALLYYLGLKIQDHETGILAAIIAGGSFYIIMASRWLSNPTPMLLLSMLLLWMMILVTEGKRWAWVLVAFISGLSLFHFGSSGEFFYFPAIAVFMLWQKSHFPTKKLLLLSILAFLFSASPLILFDMRHNGILTGNIKKFLFEEESFKVSFWEVVKLRINFYYDVFTNKIFHGRYLREQRILAAVAVSFLFFLPKFLKDTKTKIVLLLLLSPMIGLLFFQGNYGNIYDYYMTGYYLIFILMFSLVLGKLWKFLPGKLFVLYFLYVFIAVNFDVVRYKTMDNVDGPNSIALRNELQAVNWVFKDAAGTPFSVDVYVPPVIPYAYDYLFTWLGNTKYKNPPSTDPIDPLYTIYEQDPPHPERLEAWLKRQEGIGTVEKETRFGGITVQKRQRIQNEKN